MKNDAGIYKITNPNGLVYVGQSVSVKRRFTEYKRLMCKGQVKLYNSLKKYGFDKHKFEVLCYCNINELSIKERYYQDLYNVLENGLNLSLVNTINKSFVHSDATKLKISNSRQGIVFTDKHKENIRQSRIGTKLKQSTKNKLSEISKRIISKKMLSKPLPYSNIVLDLNTGVYYYSARDLSRSHNLGKTAILNRLKNNKLQGYKIV